MAARFCDLHVWGDDTYQLADKAIRFKILQVTKVLTTGITCDQAQQRTLTPNYWDLFKSACAGFFRFTSQHPRRYGDSPNE